MKNEEINSIESEAGIIASLIHKPELCFYSEYLLPNHFTNQDNRLIYVAITDLAKQGIQTIDPYNIVEDLNANEVTRRLAENITIDKLNELVEMSDILARNSVEEYKLLVSNVMDAAFRRDMFSRLQECQTMCLDGNIKDTQKQIYKIIDDTIASYSMGDEIPDYADVVDKMWEQIKERQGSGFSGIPFKFPALNEYVTIERQELIIFGAQQKVGKSIMLLNCAVDLMRQGYSVMYIDSELSTRMFTSRLLAHLSGIAYRDLTSGHYTSEDEEKIIAAKEWLKHQNFVHIYMPFFSQEEIYTAVKQINHRNNIDVLIVDYLKSNSDGDAYAVYNQLGRITDCLKNDIAGATNIAVIGAAQATINGKLADSAKIARNASTIIMLMDKTPEEIEADGVECGNKKLIVSVNRNGAQMSQGEYIDLQFDGNHILYEQAKQHVPDTPY